jgi:hypothetical protein
MLSAVLGIHQTIKHEMKYRQNVALAKSLSFLPVQRNPMPILMSLKCITQRSCALSVCLIPFLFSLFLLPRPLVFPLRHLLHVDMGTISTQWMLCIGLRVATLRILKAFRADFC